MATLSPAQFAERLREQAKALKSALPMQMASQTVHAMRVTRIFDTPGVGGSYSKKPIWIKNSQLRRKVNKGKSGRAKESSYFAGGYYEAKKSQGFDPNVVNLRMTNDLQSDFANSQKTNTTGKPPVGKPIKVNNALYIEAIRRPENVRKLKENIKRYGAFTNFTQAERDEFYKVLAFEYKKLLSGG